MFQDLVGRVLTQPICRPQTKTGLIDLKVYQIVSYFLLDLEGYIVCCSTYLSQQRILWFQNQDIRNWDENYPHNEMLFKILF